MKQLLIIGAGGFGREVLMLAIDNPSFGVDWTIKGYLDSRASIFADMVTDSAALPDAMDYSPEKRQRYNRNYPVVGDPLNYEPAPGDVFICAVGSPAERRKYAEPLVAKGAEFIRLVHPLSAVSTFAAIGAGSIIGPYASLSPDCRVGRHVSISSYTAIAHDVTIADWVEIGAHCLVAGHASVETGARVHPGSVLTARSSVGANSVVAAGSVVFKRVPPDTTVLGNPARKFDWKPDAAA